MVAKSVEAAVVPSFGTVVEVTNHTMQAGNVSPHPYLLFPPWPCAGSSFSPLGQPTATSGLTRDMSVPIGRALKGY